MKISVAMATYNGEAYIQEQMQSLLKQTSRIDEIIIYDDCSTDRTMDVMRSFLTSTTIPIKLFSQHKRVGYIQNFTSALREVSGDIVFLCDQDDIWEDTKVEEVVRLFADPKILGVATAFTYIDAKSKRIDIHDNGDNHGLCWQAYKKESLQYISQEELIYHNTAMGCTLAFRSHIKEEYLCKTNQKAAHDWELFFLAALKQGAAFYNKSLVKYRIHDKNTSGNDKINKQNHIYASEREKNARSLSNFIQGLSVYEDEMSELQRKQWQKVMKIYRIRQTMLCEGHPGLWLQLIRNYRIYHKIISKKGMLIDVLYALRK